MVSSCRVVEWSWPPSTKGVQNNGVSGISSSSSSRSFRGFVWCLDGVGVCGTERVVGEDIFWRFSEGFGFFSLFGMGFCGRVVFGLGLDSKQ